MFSMTIIAEDKVIGYFNSDIVQNSSHIIKVSSEYFEDLNTKIIIQPITRFEIISEVLNLHEIEYLIISPVLVDLVKTARKLKKSLYPVNKKGTSTYNKIVLVKGDKINNCSDIQNQTIASPSYGPTGIKLIKKYIFYEQNINFDELEIIWVKKELDSLFALSLDQVDIALVTPLCYNILKQTNPEYVVDLKVIHTSKEIPLPCLYIIDIDEKNKIVENCFIRMSETEKGKRLLNVLGIHKWKKEKE